MCLVGEFAHDRPWKHPFHLQILWGKALKPLATWKRPVPLDIPLLSSSFSVFLGNNCQINVKIDQQHACLFIADVIAHVCFLASVCSVKQGVGSTVSTEPYCIYVLYI
jgi:hypothetical protein